MAGGVAFALTPWLSLGFGTPIAFIVAAVLFRRLGKAHAAVLWLSATVYTAALIVEMITSGDQGFDPVFVACLVITMVAGGLEAAVLTVVAFVKGYRPARRNRRDAPAEAAVHPMTPRAVLLCAVLMASLGTFLVAFATVDLSPAIRAAHGQGIPGVVVPTGENCASGSYGAQECSWTGNFISNDGRIRLQDVDISDEVDKVGKPQDALYVSGGLGTTVYPPHGSLAWVFDVWCIMFGAGAWWAAIYVPVKFWWKRSSQ